MNALQLSVSALVSLHPCVITNKFSASAHAPQDGQGHLVADVQGHRVPESQAESSQNSIDTMADAAEQLITELLWVLSVGLREDVDVWDVLRTLQYIPARLAASKGGFLDKRAALSQGPGGLVNSSASSGPTGAQREPPIISSQESDAVGDATQRLCRRLNFTTQLVRIVEDMFRSQPRLVHARALLRLALNYGCLLASFELLARLNRDELLPLFSKPELSVLFHCGDTDREGGGLWSVFAEVVAPVGGVPLRELVAGAARGFSLVHFNMALLVPELDNDGPDRYAAGGMGGEKPMASSHSAAAAGGLPNGEGRPGFYRQLENYLRGVTDQAPSALAFLREKRRVTAESHCQRTKDTKEKRGQTTMRNTAGQWTQKRTVTEERPLKVKVLVLDASRSTLGTRGHGTKGLAGTLDSDVKSTGTESGDVRGATFSEGDIGVGAHRSKKHRKTRKKRPQAICSTTMAAPSRSTSSDMNQKRQEEAYVQQQRLNATQQLSKAPDMIEVLRQMRQTTRREIEAAIANTIGCDATGDERKVEDKKDMQERFFMSTSLGIPPSTEGFVPDTASASASATFALSQGHSLLQDKHVDGSSVDELLDRLEGMLNQLADCLGVNEAETNAH